MVQSLFKACLFSLYSNGETDKIVPLLKIITYLEICSKLAIGVWVGGVFFKKRLKLKGILSKLSVGGEFRGRNMGFSFFSPNWYKVVITINH